MKFNFLANVATSDLAFEAFGKDYNELFGNAALALESAQVDLASVKPNIVKKIKIKGGSLEDLLFSFLEELVFLKDSEQMLFSQVSCIVETDDANFILKAKLRGERINPQKHKLGVDVKAVTKHLFKIEKRPLKKDLMCRVVLDV